ncbi:hypothetical protein WJX81_002212 [Elliptochloris bilobata]|uniref:Uncharacterized protein n=1 Tax=Elliptochloris bilobata TaxID=381761 RepID=A0AAW1QMW4_9CHLO
MRTAALDSSATLAVTQQGIAFVVVALAEANFARSQLPESMSGRPSLVLVGLSCAAVLAGVALVNVGQGGLGLAVGTGGSGLLLVQAVQRTISVPDDPQNWPGPKVGARSS